MSSSLSAEIWVGTWDYCYDEDEYEDLHEFCEDLGLEYCVQYDSQENYFVGFCIAESEDWGSCSLDLKHLRDKEYLALSKLKRLTELADCDFVTELLPRYF